jgi:hypothetical protein
LANCDVRDTPDTLRISSPLPTGSKTCLACGQRIPQVTPSGIQHGPARMNNRKYCSRGCVNRAWKKGLRLRDQVRSLGYRNRGRIRADLHPTSRPTLQDITWAAGFYEGEGCAHHNGGWTANVMFAQKDIWPLQRLRALFGGKLSLTTKRNGRQYHTLQIVGPLARGFLFTIFTLLSPRRRRQIKEALGHGNV